MSTGLLNTDKNIFEIPYTSLRPCTTQTEPNLTAGRYEINAWFLKIP